MSCKALFITIIIIMIIIITIIIIVVVMQKIDAEEAAIWEEMLSAADMVQEEARQRYKKSKESKEVHDSLKDIALVHFQMTHAQQCSWTCGLQAL